MSDPGGLAIALITASQADEYEQMAKVLNEITLSEAGAVIASLAGLASAFLEHCAIEMGVTPFVLLHTLGVQNASHPE